MTVEQAETLADVPAGTEETNQAGISDTAEWGDFGQVRLTEVTEWPNGNSALHSPSSGQAKGKWAVVILSAADDEGIPNPGKALNLGYEILRLDDYPVASSSAFGPTSLNPRTKKMSLYGTMAFFFDVPKDYDPAKGTVTINGTPITVSAGQQAD